MVRRTSKKPIFPPISATIVIAWDTSDPSVESPCKWLTLLAVLVKGKEEEERIPVDDISHAEASLDVTPASDEEDMVVQRSRYRTEMTGTMTGKKKKTGTKN